MSRHTYTSDRSPTSEEALSSHSYCLTKGPHNVIMLSRKHSYYTQVQCQILVANIDECDFVCWTPKGIFIETISRDNCFIDKMVKKAKYFFCTYLLPELLTNKLKGELTWKKNFLIKSIIVMYWYANLQFCNLSSIATCNPKI